jgi:putative FmdB family regulatory protein
MPTYEYRCNSCGHEFEEFQKMTADALTICPKCAEPTLRRKMGSGSGMIFKGSGFYVTDYRKSSSSPAAKNSNDSKPSPPSTPSTESKPTPEKKPDKPS